MIKAKKQLIFILAILIFALPLCAWRGESEAGVSIVTTIFAPYDFAREVAGENASVKMLLSPGADSHSYDPTPKDMLAVKKCDIFICVGGTSDAWVEEMISSTGNPDMKVIKLMEHTEGLICADHSHDHSDAHDHDHGEYDEHVWSNPRNALLASEAIKNALCEVDPENADAYKSNFEAYKTELLALDAEIKEIVSGGKRKEIVFGDRFPLIYFTEAYGLTYHSAFPGCAADTEPSAATLASLINKVKTDGIPVVFHLELSKGNIADAICEATGTKKLRFNACENISKSDFDRGVTYLDLMRHNASVLREALS
jgi:zinc transport system substrate-binding protein